VIILNAKIIGSNIKRIRNEKGIKQTHIQKVTGISNVYLSNIENGVKTNPSTEVLEKIAAALGVTFSELIREPKPKSIHELVNELILSKQINSDQATVAGLILERLYKEKLIDENFSFTPELKELLEDAIKLDAKLNNNLKGSTK
jgi:transcriptional regulator with XRE-family HTH domain